MAKASKPTGPALVIAGEFTIFTAAAMKARLLDTIAASNAAEIEIDLSDVTEIDTAGLQLMIMAKQEAARRAKDVRFSGHSGPVMDLVDLCDLSGFFGDPVLIRSNH